MLFKALVIFVLLLNPIIKIRVNNELQISKKLTENDEIEIYYVL